MAKIELGKVIDLIIKEDNASVDALLENWFRQQTKIIHESIMENDDIQQDQDEIEQEEFFGSDDLTEDTDEDDTGEASDLIDPVDEDGIDIKDFSTDPEAIQDQFRDVEDDLERLEAEFDAIMGNNSSDDDDDDDITDEEEYDFTDEEEFEEDDEDFGPYDDLAESLKLDTVSLTDIDDEDGVEIGSGRTKIKANDRSPALQKGIDDRMSGAGPVEIRSTDEKGYPEFKKLPTKEVDLKGTVRNRDNGLTDVPRDGDSSAILNKKQDVGYTRSVLGDGSDTRDEVIRSIQRRK